MIRFERVSKVYKGDVVALRDVSVDVQKGEFVFLVGPSGSGKSTFLRLLLREDLPTDGRIIVAGRDITRLASWKVPQLRRNIGCIFQDYKLLPNKTVYENVAFVLLLAAALFLIVNTVRLATFARRREIEVMKLVGASNWFVRIPFLAEGFIQGLVGAGFAFAVVYFLKVRLSSALAGGTGFVQTFFLTTRDAWSIGLLVLVLGAAIGVIASAVGLRRFLDV